MRKKSNWRCQKRTPTLFEGMGRTIACLLLLVPSLCAFAQGKLDAVRDEVNRPRTDNSSDKKDTYDPDDREMPDGLNLFFFHAFLAPWAVPNEFLDVKGEAGFVSHPFPAPDTPYLSVDNPDLPWAERLETYYDRHDTKPYAIRAAGEIGSDFNNVSRVGLRLFLDTASRFGLKSDWDYYTERLPCGCYDSLWLGDLTATYRFVQSEQFQMHTGLGARVLLDRGDDRAGFNFLYGFDAFPIDRVHAFGSLEAGTLGNAGVWRLRGGMGVHWNLAEFFAGYDYFRIGSATLQGPFTGLRLWF